MLESEQNKNKEEQPKEEKDEKLEATTEDSNSNFVDFQRVPTQLLKSDILNSTSTTDGFQRKVLRT